MTFQKQQLNKALSHLSNNDPIMRILTEKLHLEISESRSVGFSSFVKIIINQQLSNKAAATIYSRLENDLFHGELSPRKTLQIDCEEFRQCGVSSSKTKYIKCVAEKFIEQPDFLNDLRPLSDEEVMERLLKIKGIGKWTAYIFLLFYLERQNVFCFGDGSLGRAITCLYDIDFSDPIALNEIITPWSPYKSFACLMLWRWVDDGMPSITD